MKAETGIIRLGKDLDVDFEFAQDILIGLSREPKVIPSKWFYDARGSEIFEEIMKLPEYYPTRCEIEILTESGDVFVDTFGEKPLNLVEVGPGNGLKTMILLEALTAARRDLQYTPIDISEPALEPLVDQLGREFPGLKVYGVVADAFRALGHVSRASDRRTVFLVLGGNLGNLPPAECKSFLHRVWNELHDGDLAVIGFDLKKDIHTMLRAYDDSQGVTREFNLNLLRRINRELGGTFDIEAFMHYPTYNAHLGAMESYLVSRKEQKVRIDGLQREFPFRKLEPIQTESSFKYLESDIIETAEATGFRVVRNLTDSDHFFIDSIWSVVKDG